jgi:uncharacterized protein YbjT (DUF2867 family)
MRSVLLTGATGFVGSATRPALLQHGVRLQCASRQRHTGAASPSESWVQVDVAKPDQLRRALYGIDTAMYLVHGMGRRGGQGDYAAREAQSAERFGAAAREVGVGRIVYLGGVCPAGTPSKHLASRRRVGELLRASGVPTVELRAGMIVGAKSESFRIVRDLSLRLPAMVLPRWLEHRSQPVAIADVVAALVHAGCSDHVAPGVYALDGPEALSAREMLERVAALEGLEARKVGLPFLTPRLSSYWIGLVTRADLSIARELAEGLRTDLYASDPSYWPLMGGHRPLRFDVAARHALAEEARQLPMKAAVLEWVIHHVVPWKRKTHPIEGLS